MKYKNLLVSIVAVFALLALASFASAYNDFGSITSVKVNDVETTSNTLAVFAGETLPVRVTFNTNAMSGMSATEDVRIRVWIAGARETSQVTDRIDVLPNRVYSTVLPLEIPYDLDSSENLSLEVTVESKNNGMLRLSTPITLAGQRESYEVQVLDVAMDNPIDLSAIEFLKAYLSRFHAEWKGLL